MSLNAPPIIDGYNVEAITAANTKLLGTGVVTFVTSPRQVPTYWKRAIVYPQGANTAKSVIRFYSTNEQHDNNTAGNNRFLFELDIPITTALTDAAQPKIEERMNLWLPPMYRIFVTLGSALLSGVTVTMIGGDYQYE